MLRMQEFKVTQGDKSQKTGLDSLCHIECTRTIGNGRGCRAAAEAAAMDRPGPKATNKQNK